MPVLEAELQRRVRDPLLLLRLEEPSSHHSPPLEVGEIKVLAMLKADPGALMLSTVCSLVSVLEQGMQEQLLLGAPAQRSWAHSLPGTENRGATRYAQVIKDSAYFTMVC